MTGRRVPDHPPPPPQRTRGWTPSAAITAVTAAPVVLGSSIAQAGTDSFAVQTVPPPGGSLPGLFSGGGFGTDALLDTGNVGGFGTAVAGAPKAADAMVIREVGIAASDLIPVDRPGDNLRFSAADAAEPSLRSDSLAARSEVTDSPVDAGAMRAVSAVPEPAAVVMMFAGLALMGILRSRRRD